MLQTELPFLHAQAWPQIGPKSFCQRSGDDRPFCQRGSFPSMALRGFGEMRLECAAAVASSANAAQVLMARGSLCERAWQVSVGRSGATAAERGSRFVRQRGAKERYRPRLDVAGVVAFGTYVRGVTAQFQRWSSSWNRICPEKFPAPGPEMRGGYVPVRVPTLVRGIGTN